MVVVLFTGVGLILPCFKGNWIVPQLLPAVMLYMLFTAFAAVLADDFNPEVQWEWYGLLAGLLFFVALHQLPNSLRWEQHILWIIFFSGATQAGLGCLQYYAASINGYSFGPTFATGSFYQVNNFSSYLATAALAPLLLHLPKRHSLIVQSGFVLMLAVAGFAMNLAASRTGLLGVALGLVLILCGRYKSQYKYHKGLSADAPSVLSGWLWALAIMVGYLLAYWFERPALVDKMVDLSNLDVSPRLGLYQGTWNLFLQEPLFGHGLGTFTSNFQEAYVASMEHLDSSNILEGIHFYPHNELLYRLAESGLLGGIGLLLIAGTTLSFWWHLKGQQGCFYAGLLFPLLLHTQTEYPFYHSLLSWVLFLTILYLTSRHFVASYHVAGFGVRSGKAGVLVVVASTLVSTVFLVEKTIRSIDMQQAVMLTKYSQQQTPMPSLQRLLNANLNDRYFAQRSRRLLMLHQADWITNSATSEESAVWLEQLHAAYRYVTSSEYYFLHALALTRQQKFDQAWALLQQARRLYPDSTKKSQLERVILQKWLAYFINHPNTKWESDHHISIKTVSNRYINWLEVAINDKGIVLSALDYNFGVHSLHYMGKDTSAIKLLERARNLHPEAAILEQWQY